MAGFPVIFDVVDKLVVVVGAGSVATRRAEALIKAGASLRVVAPEATDELQELAASGTVEWRQRRFQRIDLLGAALVLVATDNSEVNREVLAQARDLGIPANAADGPNESDFIVPATAELGRLRLTVDTGGAGPAISKALRRHLEATLSPGWSRAADIAAALRPHLLATVDPDRRRAFWRAFAAELPDATAGTAEQTRAWLTDLAAARGIDLNGFDWDHINRRSHRG